MHRTLLVTGVALLAAFAGCLDDEDNPTDAAGDDHSDAEHREEQRVQFANNGQFRGHIDEKTLECDADGALDFAANGQGTLYVTVTDGNGTTIADYTFEGQGQGADHEPLAGAAGTWTVTISTDDDSFLPFQPGGFQGQYAGALTC